MWFSVAGVGAQGAVSSSSIPSLLPHGSPTSSGHTGLDLVLRSEASLQDSLQWSCSDWSPAVQNLGQHPERLGRNHCLCLLAFLVSIYCICKVPLPWGARGSAWKRGVLSDTQERLRLCKARRLGCPSGYFLLGSGVLPPGRLRGPGVGVGYSVASWERGGRGYGADFCPRTR